MSEGAAIAISSPRVRAISFASSALVVTLICLVLLLLSRVVAQLEHTPISGVQVEIVTREEAPRQPARMRALPPPSGIAPTAPGAGTEIPFDQAMLARTLNCFRLRESEPRPPECPPATQADIESAGGFFPTDRELDLLTNPPANSAQAFAGIPPRCVRGFSRVNPTRDSVALQFCRSGGLVPQETARAPEVVCEAGGIGPCRPPAFREEDVVRLPHTQ